MDTQLLLRFLHNKTGEIQSLLEHFKLHPSELKNGLDLLHDRIESLNNDYVILKKSFDAKTCTEQLSVVPEPDVPDSAAEQADEPSLLISEELQTEEELHQHETSVHPKSTNFTSLNDKLQQASCKQFVGEKLGTQKLDDIQSAIGINDRFLFTRELFNNDPDAYRSAISFINAANGFETVLNWMEKEQDWDLEHPTVVLFTELIKRKF